MSFKASLKRWLGLQTPAVPYTRDLPQYAKYRIGRGTYGTPAVHDWDEGSTLVIGQYTSIASGVTILLGGEHRTDWASTYPFNQTSPQFAHLTGHPRSKGDVVIGNDVWIGYGATLLSGVTVGDGAVIGACSVVSRPVAPYSIVAGVPARHVRFRFETEVVAALQTAAWWDLPDTQIQALVPLLLSSDIPALLRAVTNVRSGASS